MELIAMSERDLQRIEVLSKVAAGGMTMVSAAHVLDVSTRQVRRLLTRMSIGGAASIRHKAIGRPSNNRSDGSYVRHSRRQHGERLSEAWPQAGSADGFHE